MSNLSIPHAPAGPSQRQVSLQRTLLALLDTSHAVANSQLDALSDLSRSQQEQFQATWASLSDQRRRDLVTALIEFAEDHIDANFAAIYRWLLEDGDPWIRTQAIEGLWEDEDVRLITPLIHRLERDPDPDVRAAAALSLGRFLLLGEYGQIDAGAVQRVTAILLAAYRRAQEELSVQRRLLEALANSSLPELPALILSAYQADDDTLRIGALFAMGRSADPRWNRTVLQELDNNDSAMLFEAVRASGELELEEAVPHLLRLLGDEDIEIRDAAVWALGRIGGREAWRALKACCTSGDEGLAEAAENALAELEFMAGDDTMPSFFAPI